ncbi:MAG TPA: enolase C-terminal domain-like protein [Candidatus Sulfotelmatobacter sp.]|nr:enolase C-terminal domain-like protein [Candidatus Sulfotelmatobacter sp.]
MSTATAAPVFRVVEIALFERDVALRLPFRFGVVTLTRATQAFVRARIVLRDGGGGWGAAAEILAPKWFDKDLALSDEDNADQLRAALREARGLYLGERTPRTAFGHFAAHHAEQIARCGARGLNRLIAGYGPALIDRAVLDALCRQLGVSVYQALGRNLAGIAPAGLAPDLDGFDIDGFLARQAPRSRIAARHTVGLVDPITAADQDPASRVDDGLPETLEDVVATYRHRWFKLKVGGDLAADVARLTAIARVLDRSALPYRSTLDGNEQYEDADAVLALWRRMTETPALQRLCDSVAFIEQPINRKAALARDVGALARLKPVIIDESDDGLDVFPRALALGYGGVSSKSCKGLYKSLINAARCAQRSRAGSPCFMSGEDLTTQAGLAVQQDLALVAFLGLEHVERNGHHYVDGMAALPAGEQDAFLAAHPDLYERSHGAVRLRLTDGELAIGSLACPGFASAAEPDWRAMRAVD